MRSQLLLYQDFEIIYGYLNKINEFRKNNKSLETCDESSMKTFNEILNSVKKLYIYFNDTNSHNNILKNNIESEKINECLKNKIRGPEIGEYIDKLFTYGKETISIMVMQILEHYKF